MNTVLFLILTAAAGAAETPKAKPCVCTCIVKNEEGKYETREAKGKNREEAGEALKKRLGKLKCEISPDCKGGCNLE